MESKMFFKLVTKMGSKKVELLIKNISTLKTYNENVLKNITIGDNNDAELFKRFKKLLMCNILCLSNFSKNNPDFPKFYEMFKLSSQQLYDQTEIDQSNKKMNYCKFLMFCK